MKPLNFIALILLIVGGLNWGLSIFDFNLVTTIFGSGIIVDVIYALVGLSAILMIFTGFKKYP